MLSSLLIMKYGRTIKDLRESKGFSQDELSLLMSCTQGVISHYELDFRVPSSGAVQKLANIFSLKVSEFFRLVEADQIHYETPVVA